MKYSINRSNHRDFDIYEINKKAGRAYFIPYSSKEKLAGTAPAAERVSSDLVWVLSGDDWAFKYYAKEADLPDELDTDVIEFDTIHVPATWQRTGYEPPVYLNCPYEFETVPPELPEEMSVGVYRKNFSITSLAERYSLAFLGVCPCINLYLNGSFVGYSEGSHNTAEFDVTPYLKEGENELLAVVPKWSTGTYLECQDMFRENGIFRDVLLYALPAVSIEDYQIHTRKTATGWHLDVGVTLSAGTEGYSVRVGFENGGEWTEAEAPAEMEAFFSFASLGVEEWNAEIPTVYEIYITLLRGGQEVQTLRNITGFKTIAIHGKYFTFNGERIKLKGVNHHDDHYKNGYVMSYADYEKDVQLIKSLNGNCVRTSHYPPDPHLLVLADLYGLYIVDEADIETHGCGEEPHRNPQLISNNVAWAPRYVDRILRMYLRDRNHPCITMWSLGNEAEGWACQDVAYDALKALCPEIPVHYEGVIRTPRLSYDVSSEMYTAHADLVKIREGKRRDRRFREKPFYMCEYAHAMGVGPGSMEEYWQIIYSDDIFLGGCIWEWADHAVFHEEGDGPWQYTYGGNHGERKHDGEFCVDGLVYPDRRLHTGALEMQAVYRPVRARRDADGSFIFTNTNRFRNANYITVEWCFLKNGLETSSGSFALNIPPQGEQRVCLEYTVPGRCDFHVNFTYKDENGNFIAKEQLELANFRVLQARRRGKTLSMQETKEKLRVAFDGGSILFDKLGGYLESYKLGEKEFIQQAPADAAGFMPNIFRAFIDNDRALRSYWEEAGHDKYELVLRDFVTNFVDEEDESEATMDLLFDLKVGSALLARAELSYKITPGGALEISASLSVKSHKEIATNLLRFGLMLEMPHGFEQVEYYGLGEAETLSDFTPQATVGIYSTTVSDMHEPYIRPQDSGNRTQVRWMKLTDAAGDGLLFCNGDKPFSFNVRHFSQKLLQKAKHQEDLHDENTTVVSIDGFLRGSGSASCGPEVLPEYLVDASKGLEYKFVVIPLKR